MTHPNSMALRGNPLRGMQRIVYECGKRRRGGETIATMAARPPAVAATTCSSQRRRDARVLGSPPPFAHWRSSHAGSRVPLSGDEWQLRSSLGCQPGTCESAPCVSWSVLGSPPFRAFHPESPEGGSQRSCHARGADPTASGRLETVALFQLSTLRGEASLQGPGDPFQNKTKKENSFVDPFSLFSKLFFIFFDQFSIFGLNFIFFDPFCFFRRTIFHFFDLIFIFGLFFIFSIHFHFLENCFSFLSVHFADLIFDI